MSSYAKSQGWLRGCTEPSGPGVYEIHYMGRCIKVHVKRDPERKLMVYGVPGHLEEGLPISDFDMFTRPRIDVSCRTHASNLNEYDRAVSRMIAGLTALRAALEAISGGEIDELYKRWNESQFDMHDIDSEIALSYRTVSDREGVEKAVRERMEVWDIEDRESIPLPSYGPGAPPEGKNLNGRTV